MRLVLALTALLFLSGCASLTPAQRPAAGVAPATPIARASQPGQPAVPAPTQIPVATITVQEVKALLDGPSKPFVFDARSRPQYDEGHVAGAVSIPLDELAARVGEVPRDRLVVVYCSGST